MSRTQRKYDHEYKVQAVKLAREIGGAKAAKELGIPEGTIHTWLKAVRAGTLDIGDGAHTPDSAMTVSYTHLDVYKRQVHMYTTVYPSPSHSRINSIPATPKPITISPTIDKLILPTLIINPSKFFSRSCEYDALTVFGRNIPLIASEKVNTYPSKVEAIPNKAALFAPDTAAKIEGMILSLIHIFIT